MQQSLCFMITLFFSQSELKCVLEVKRDTGGSSRSLHFWEQFTVCSLLVLSAGSLALWSYVGKHNRWSYWASLPKKHFPALSHASLLPLPCGWLGFILEWEWRVNLSSLLFFWAHSLSFFFFYGNCNRLLKELIVCFQSAKKGRSRKLLFASCPVSSCILWNFS